MIKVQFEGDFLRNVFHPAFGSKPERVIGRDDIVSDFIAGLSREPGHRDRATILIGQRGIGKTALLLLLADKATQANFVTARVAAGEDMLNDIIESIQLNGADSIKKKHSAIRGFSAGGLGFSLGLTFSEEVSENYGFRTKLSLLCDKLAENNKGIVLLVDEVQPNSDAMRTLASTYQHLAGEGKNIAIVMAGLPSSVSNVLNDKVLTFLNRARKKELGLLSINDITSYYLEAFKTENRTIAPDIALLAAKATQGFPYLLQLLGYYAIEYSAPGGTITDSVVSAAIDSAKLDMESDVFAPTLNTLSKKDRQIATAIAAFDGKTATTADICATLGISNSYFQQYRARLIKSGVIAPKSTGEVEIIVPYLGEYLQTHN
jgi:hypothetical protein